MSKFRSIVFTSRLGSSLSKAELMRLLRLEVPIFTQRSRGNDRIAACDSLGSTRSNMIVSDRSPMSFALGQEGAGVRRAGVDAGAAVRADQEVVLGLAPDRSRRSSWWSRATHDRQVADAGRSRRMRHASRRSWMTTRRVPESVSLAVQMSPAAASAPTMTRELKPSTARWGHVRRGREASRGTGAHASGGRALPGCGG